MSVVMHLLPRLKVDSIQTRVQTRESEMPLVCRMTDSILSPAFSEHRQTLFPTFNPAP